MYLFVIAKAVLSVDVPLIVTLPSLLFVNVIPLSSLVSNAISGVALPLMSVTSENNFWIFASCSDLDSFSEPISFPTTAESAAFPDTVSVSSVTIPSLLYFFPEVQADVLAFQ